jgi:hypothetical protein
MAILTILHSIRACFVVDHTSLNFRHRSQEEYFRLHDDVLRHCLHLFPGVLPRSFIVHVLFSLGWFRVAFRKPVLLGGTRIGWCISGWRLLRLCVSASPAFTHSCFSLACFSNDYGFLSCFPALHVHRCSWARNNWCIWNCDCKAFCFALIGSSLGGNWLDGHFV